MSVVYELWDTFGGNLINAYDTECEALERVRESIDDYGVTAIDAWVLIADDEDAEDAEAIASGPELALRSALPTIDG